MPDRRPSAPATPSRASYTTSASMPFASELVSGGTQKVAQRETRASAQLPRCPVGRASRVGPPARPSGGVVGGDGDHPTAPVRDPHVHAGRGPLQTASVALGHSVRSMESAAALAPVSSSGEDVMPTSSHLVRHCHEELCNLLLSKMGQAALLRSPSKLQPRSALSRNVDPSASTA